MPDSPVSKPAAALKAVPKVERVAKQAIASAAPVTQPPIIVSSKGTSVMATAASIPTGNDTVRNAFGDVRERAKSTLERGAKIAEEIGEFAKGNVEALVTSGRVAAKGFETIGQDVADYSRRSLEGATTAFKGFAAAKSPTELFQLQSDYARSSFDTFVAEGSKLTEAWLKLAGEVAQPLSSRIAVAAERIKTPLSA